MAPSAWKPLTDDEAIRKADEEYLREERTGQWSKWKSEGAPPWWIAGCQWVDTVLRLASVHRAVLVERRFDDTLRGRLVGEVRRLSVEIYNRKIWHHDAPLPDPRVRGEFVAWTQRELAPTLAMIDQEVLICTELEEIFEQNPQTQDPQYRKSQAVSAAIDAPNREIEVNTFLSRCNQELPFKVLKKHIWAAAKHRTGRQFQYWQANSKDATAQDMETFSRILAMSPQHFHSLLLSLKVDGVPATET